MAAVESTRLRLAAARRPRRSHAERRAETRAKIIDGVVESIADIGLAATTATEIARRSGATWGAVQHHFGDKDGLMSAVLEESFNRFAERIDAIPVAGTDLEQRSSCAAQVTAFDLPGFAIGGVSVGEGHELLCRVTEHTAPLLPEAKPRYLMGVGLPEDILAAIGYGMDLFDCVIPTRYARSASVFTHSWLSECTVISASAGSFL